MNLFICKIKTNDQSWLTSSASIYFSCNIWKHVAKGTFKTSSKTGIVFEILSTFLSCLNKAIQINIKKTIIVHFHLLTIENDLDKLHYHVQLPFLWLMGIHLVDHIHNQHKYSFVLEREGNAQYHCVTNVFYFLLCINCQTTVVYDMFFIRSVLDFFQLQCPICKVIYSGRNAC